MSKRLSLRKIRKPNIEGSSFLDGEYLDNRPEVDESQTDNKQVTGEFQTGNKQVTNGYQTGNKRVTGEFQTGNKQVTNGYQTGNNKDETKVQTGNKRVTKRVTERVTNNEQIGNKRITGLCFESLVGHERNLLSLIFSECLRVGSLIAPPLTLDFIEERLECRSGTAKTVIHRLIKKGFMYRSESKTGRGGWIKFELPKNLYQNLRIRETDNKRVTNGYQTGNKQVTKRVTERVTKSPSSSSSDLLLIKKLIKKNTTTTTPLDEGLGIDIPDNLKEIGFGASQTSHVFNNAKNPLTPQELQDSLDAFSYDLKQELIKPKTSPLNFLMGVLLKRGAYTSEAILIESKKEIESYMKTIKELEISMEDLKSVNKQKQFEKWLKTIPDDERNKIVPPSPLIKTGSRYQLVMLKDYWEKEINPNNS